ncbi:MAG: glycosyltransferase family 39 protein [Chloroflexota bacterium]
MRHRLTLLALLLIAALFRLVGLNNGSPPGLTHDEVANWLIDQSILAGNHAVYFTRAYGHEAGFHYIQTLFITLLGDNALALRLPAAFAGILLVAIVYVLGKRLFGRQVGVLAMGLTAVLLWPIFFSRLAFRAIWLPVLSSLSALAWWQGWHKNSERWLLLAGLLAGLSLHTYMAARAVPIFYALFFAYLFIVNQERFWQNWRGLGLFIAAYAIVAAPLILFLQTNSGAEFRIAEVDAPLRALLAGDVRPVWENGLNILAGFGFSGDPLWRQNVANQPVFDPVVATMFYLSLPLLLWKIGDSRYGFLLFWALTAVSPSLVTINAPSTIRMINILPILTILPAIVTHNLIQLSTVIPKLSTALVKIVALAGLGYYIWWSGASIFQIWPQNEEVGFVWQAALTETAVFLDNNPHIKSASLAGWSPDTMDVPTMRLSLKRDVALSHFNPQEGTLVLSRSDDKSQHHLYRPAILELAPHWENQLSDWGATPQQEGQFVAYEVPAYLPTPQIASQADFGQALRFLGYDEVAANELVTYWQVLATPNQATRLFIHLLDADGDILAEDYRLDAEDPQAIWFPHWQPDDLILQHHALPMPLAEAAALRIGWFDPYTCATGACQNLLTSEGEPFILLLRV